MRTILAALVVFCCTAANAGLYLDNDGRDWWLLDPPRQYLDATLPAGTLHFHNISRPEVWAACEHATGKAEQYGCAIVWPDGSRCEIYVADDLPEPFWRAVVSHEWAHCVGWPADHPLD